jgi:hypothetical protein
MGLSDGSEGELNPHGHDLQLYQTWLEHGRQNRRQT